MYDSLRPHGLYSPWNSPDQNPGVGEVFPSPGDLPNPGIEPRSPALPADSLPAEPRGKPKKTGVGSLSLLQGIFPIQESNWGLLHCRKILYQLSYENTIKKLHSVRQGQKIVTHVTGKRLKFLMYHFSSVQFNRSVVSNSLRPHESQHARPPCPSLTPGVHSDSRPSSQ